MTEESGGDLNERSIEEQIDEMEEWFRSRFEDPAMRTPYESAEGGYQWIWGGPYDAREQLESEFGHIYASEAIDSLADKLSSECPEWAPTERPGDYDDEWFESISGNVLSRFTLDQDLNGVEALLGLATGHELASRLRRLLFANVITALETYLSDTFMNRVLQDPERIQAHLDADPRFKERKVPYKDVLREAAKLEQAVRSELLDMVWHDLSRVKPMYKAALGVDLGEIGDLMKDVLVRHDIVHRNGRSKTGELVDIQPAQITELTAKVRALATSIDEQLNPTPEVPPMPPLDPGDVPF